MVDLIYHFFDVALWEYIDPTKAGIICSLAVVMWLGK
jgi:hypothetical protein